MKIAHVTSTFPPYRGGIGNIAYYNAKELAKLGHEITVFTPLYEQKEFDDKKENFKVERLKAHLKYGNGALVAGLTKKLADFDIVHLHYPCFGLAEDVWWLKTLKKKTKLVINYQMDVVGQGVFKLFFGLHTKLILPKILKSADIISASSFDYIKNSNIANYFAKHQDKFVEVPNGVDSEHFRPEVKSEEILSRHGLSLNNKVIIFVGGLDKAHYFKGIDYLIQAFMLVNQRMPETRLMIVGEGDLVEEYKSLAAQLQISDRIVFTGGVGHDDLPKYYNSADLGVLPSIDKSEAFGIVLIEAMACAKPVVASNLAGVRSVVDEEENGYLSEPRNIDDLASKLNHLLVNDELRIQMGQNGREKVMAQYDWRAIASKIDGIYKSLA